MSGLEVHTLIQETNELPQALLSRAGAIAAGGAALDYAYKAPESPGAFSFTQLDEYLGLPIKEPASRLVAPPESPALTTIPDFLPSISSQEELLGNLQESELMGELMLQVRLSKLTGCFMRPQGARNHNGYSKVKSQAAKEIGLGSYRDAHRVAHFLYTTHKSGNLPAEEDLKLTVDHKCRNPSCCNPLHTRLVSGRENNVLKDKAKKLEPKIIEGQQFYWPDLRDRLPWLENTIINDEVEIPEKVISTRIGPFALLACSRDQALVIGHRLSCEVYDGLRPLSKNNYFAPSRAKPFKPVKDNTEFFHKNKFKKMHRPTQAELYEAQRLKT